jgi:hypothetical protein
MELSIPRRARPISEQLLREDGAPSDRTLAQRLIRQLQREAEAQPGARLAASCAPAVAKAAEPLARQLAERIGARFAIKPDPAAPRERLEVAAI